MRRAGLMRPEDAGQLQMTDSDEEEQARGITIFYLCGIARLL